MYRYDQYDQAIVDTRVEEFRDQVARRIAGEMTDDQFKPLRLKNGLYLQLHAYMLRIAIPYGTINSRQLRVLAHIARTYDRGYGHFTTRQNLQFNWIRLEDAPDILAELAKVEMHAIQTSGESIRNISADQFAGAAADEVCDPRPWAELIRQYTTFHPEFSYLPRKFKIGLTASDNDRAAIQLHDVGLQVRRGPEGDIGFRVYVGGGMGRTPFVASLVRDFLPANAICSYLEAILRVWNRNGRRDNIHKQRIKILVHDLGAEEFTRQVEEEWQALQPLGDDMPLAEYERIAAFFAPPPFEQGLSDDLDLSDPRFAAWVERNVHAHKQPGYAIATISLKPIGGIPGDVSADQIDLLADLAEKYSFDELRPTHAQNVVLPHVRKADLYGIWQQLDAAGLATANLDLISEIIACPGLDYCSLANTRSIPLAQKLAERFADPARQLDIGELKLKISGCINACGHHHVGHIGLLGLEKNGEEFYQITIGGQADEDAALGQLLGPAVPYAEVADVVEDVVAAYVELRERPDEIFLDTVKRIGVEPFKERVYAAR